MVKATRPFGCEDRSVIEDLVQDTYQRLCDNRYQALYAIKTEQSEGVFAFVKSVAYATTVDHFRKQGAAKRGGLQRPVSLNDLVSDIGTGVCPENQLETRLLLDKVSTQLEEDFTGETAKRDLSVFWLHYRQGFTASEISRIPSIGLTAKGVESLLRRAIEGLKSQLGGARR